MYPISIGMPMIRRASGILVPVSHEAGKRIAHVEAKFDMKPNHLYFTTRALHWEQSKRGEFSGNDNADFFEGGSNVVWACNNKRCANKDDQKRFLKYASKDSCPHCDSKDIRDWEFEIFAKKGELLTKNESGDWRWQTWKGQPLNRNHDDKERLGSVVDVWPVPPEKGIDQLLEVDTGSNKHLAEKIARGQVTGTSMEVLVGASLCSICFHIATDEKSPKEQGGWCEHLRLHKGRYDPKSGKRVFEINKNLIGSGLAVIDGGEPADQGARIHQVFASAEIPSNLNPVMATKPRILKSDNNLPKDTKGMPQISSAVQDHIDRNAANRRSVQSGKAPGRSESSNLPAAQVSIPDFKNMGDQLQVFGNYMSSRSAEEVAMAKLPPSLRAKLALLDQLDPKTKIAMGLEKSEPLRVDKEFIAAHLKPVSATKKVASKDLLGALVVMVATEGERVQFAEALKTRSAAQASGAVSRLASRRAQLTDPEGIRELVIDTLSDALSEAASNVAQSVTDETVSDVLEGSDNLTDTDEHQDNFIAFLDEGNSPEEPTDSGEIASDTPAEENSEGSSKEAVMTKEIPLSQVEATDEDKNMSKTAQVIPHVTTQDKTPTEIAAKPSDLGGNGLNENPKALDIPAATERTTPGETFPFKSVMAALQERKASLTEQLLSADAAEYPAIVASLKKVEAQMKIEVESFPDAKQLGGAPDKNPAPVDVVRPTDRTTGPEDMPGNNQGAVDVAGGKGIPHVAQSKFEGSKPEVATAPSDRSTKSEEFPASKEQTRDDPTARKMEKEVHPGNKDNALAKDKMTKANGDASKTDQENKNQGVASPSTGDANTTDIKNKGEASPTVKEDGAAQLKLEGKDATTPTISDKEQDKLQGKTEVTKAANPSEDIKLKGQDAETKSEDNYGDAKSISANPGEGSYPQEMLRSGELTADFTENTTPGQRSASFWEVKLNGEPMLRISAKNAFEDEVVEHYASFASSDYGRKLVETLREKGVQHLAEAVFNKGALEVVKKAQSVSEGMPSGTPAATEPVNVAPSVADRVLNDAKPGIGVIALLANLLAPVVAESESLSTSGAIQDIVELATNQDKVTELTTKLNDAVQQIRSSSGLPNEQGAPAAQPQIAPAGAPAPMAEAQSTVPAPAAQGTTSMTAQAALDPKIASLEEDNRKLKAQNSALLRGQRLEQVVKQAQACGILDNFNKFARAGKSRKEAKRLAMKVIADKVTQLLALPNEACEQVIDSMLTACKAVSLASDKTASRRAAALQQMVQENGGTKITASLGGEVSHADALPATGKKSMSLSWKVANNIDPAKHEEAFKNANVRKSD